MLASRYGWSIEYIEALEFDFVMALLYQAMIKPHFMYVNEDLLKEYHSEDSAEEADKSMPAQQTWQPKVVDPNYTKTDQYQRAQLASMMKSAGVSKEQIKKQLAKITPEVMAIHAEIDKQMAIISGGATTTGKQKYDARVQISKLVKRLYKLGVIVPIGGR